jgi:hypothetical protein
MTLLRGKRHVIRGEREKYGFVGFCKPLDSLITVVRDGGEGGPQKKGSAGRVVVVVITDGRCNGEQLQTCPLTLICGKKAFQKEKALSHMHAYAVSLHDSGDADVFAGSKYTLTAEEGGELSQSQLRQEVLNLLKLLRSKKLQVNCTRGAICLPTSLFAWTHAATNLYHELLTLHR